MERTATILPTLINFFGSVFISAMAYFILGYFIISFVPRVLFWLLTLNTMPLIYLCVTAAILFSAMNLSLFQFFSHRNLNKIERIRSQSSIEEAKTQTDKFVDLGEKEIRLTLPPVPPVPPVPPEGSPGAGQEIQELPSFSPLNLAPGNR